MARRHVLFGSHTVLKVGTFHIKRKKEKKKASGFLASHEGLEAMTTPGRHLWEPCGDTSLRRGSDSFAHVRVHVDTHSVPGTAWDAGNSAGSNRHRLYERLPSPGERDPRQVSDGFRDMKTLQQGCCLALQRQGPTLAGSPGNPV